MQFSGGTLSRKVNINTLYSFLDDITHFFINQLTLQCILLVKGINASMDINVAKSCKKLDFNYFFIVLYFYFFSFLPL